MLIIIIILMIIIVIVINKNNINSLLLYVGQVYIIPVNYIKLITDNVWHFINEGEKLTK